MNVEYTNQEAQLVANLLNDLKLKNEGTASVANTALEKLLEASKATEKED